MLKKFLNLFKQNYSKANNPVADKKETTDDYEDITRYEAKVLSKKNKQSVSAKAAPSSKVNDINYYNNSKRMTGYNKLLSIDEIERIHSYYFNNNLAARFKNIRNSDKSLNFNSNKVDAAVFDYIVGWATIEKICSKHKLNSRKLYEYIHLIKDIVNKKDKHV